ncbi:MAG TPA: hypothetical protein VHX63_14735, partial [Acidobacteriaceae bacterium]|nr:hypothetical protein [Acidobacteriaceae bacterium]
AFGQGVINHGHIGSPFTISFSSVNQRGPRERRIRNAMTGETINIRASSRQREQFQALLNPSQIVEADGRTAFSPTRVFNSLFSQSPLP